MAEGEGNINIILSRIGVPGRYQIFTFTCTFIIGIVSTFQTVGLAFIQADLSYRCSEEDGLYNSTFSDSNDVFNNSCLAPGSSTDCQEFTYDHSVFKSTIISEFNLVCSRAKYVAISNLVYNGMGIPCGVFTGWLSDRVGRKPCIIGHLIVIGIVGVITAFSVNIEMYIVLKVLISAPIGGLFDSINSHLSEITAPVKRPHVLIGSGISWAIAILLMSGLSYLIRDWVYLQIIISAPCLVLAAISYWAYDESPHWLYSKGRYMESQKVLETIARWNKLDISDMSVLPDKYELKDASEPNTEDKELFTEETTNKDDVDGEHEIKTSNDEDTRHGCIRILKSPRFLAIFFIGSFGWLSCNLGYSGLLYGIGDLVGDLYINNTLGGVAELIAYFLCFVILKGGRKYVYVSFGLVGGLSLIASGVFTLYLPDVTWVIITLTMLGRLCISSAWQVLYVWCIELFPTSVRNTMLQSSFAFGYVGTTLGPLMADLEKVVTNPSINITVISPFTYGTIFALSGLSALYLPETNNKPLPVTIGDAITMSQKRKQQNYEDKSVM